MLQVDEDSRSRCLSGNGQGFVSVRGIQMSWAWSICMQVHTRVTGWATLYECHSYYSAHHVSGGQVYYRGVTCHAIFLSSGNLRKQ